MGTDVGGWAECQCGDNLWGFSFVSVCSWKLGHPRSIRRKRHWDLKRGEAVQWMSSGGRNGWRKYSGWPVLPGPSSSNHKFRMRPVTIVSTRLAAFRFHRYRSGVSRDLDLTTCRVLVGNYVEKRKEQWSWWWKQRSENWSWSVRWLSRKDEDPVEGDRQWKSGTTNDWIYQWNGGMMGRLDTTGSEAER